MPKPRATTRIAEMKQIVTAKYGSLNEQDLPDVFDMMVFAAVMDMSYARASRYLKQVENSGEPFKVVRIGQEYRISKAALFSWLAG